MSRLQASLLGGLFIGILSVLPIVNLANFCCCLWVVVGGGLTTYLRQQGHPFRLEPSEVGVSGFLAGLIGGLISGIFAVIMLLAVGDMNARIRQMVEQVPQLPPELRDQLLAFDAGGAFVLVSSLISLPVYAVFSMLGALLALLFFRKPPAPAAQA